eukprot:3361530-Prymnesium_polylepis.1
MCAQQRCKVGIWLRFGSHSASASLTGGDRERAARRHVGALPGKYAASCCGSSTDSSIGFSTTKKSPVRIANVQLYIKS